jgi:hypothetical protein
MRYTKMTDITVRCSSCPKTSLNSITMHVSHHPFIRNGEIRKCMVCGEHFLFRTNGKPLETVNNEVTK